MEKKKTNNLIVFLVFILTAAACAGFIWFKLQEVEKNKTNDDKKKSSETSKKDTKEDKKETTPTEDTIKYDNYTELVVSEDTNGKFILKINNGVFEGYYGNTKLKVSGIEGKAKSFVQGVSCDPNMQTLVITEDNKLFISNYYAGTYVGENNQTVNFDSMEFKELKTDLEVVNITKHQPIKWAGSRCGDYSFAVVLKNKEIRAIYSDNNGNYNIGTFDYSIIKQVFYASGSRIILYSDNTISDHYYSASDNYYEYNAKVNEKLKYNNENIVADKIINLTNDSSNSIYVVSNNKLYKINMVVDGPITKSINITLVNNSDIKSETLEVSKGLNSYDIEKTDTITFTDGNSITISNISSIYSVK